MILDPLIGGIAMGCIYSLIALGYNMLIRAMNLLHFAQGEVMMVGPGRIRYPRIYGSDALLLGPVRIPPQFLAPLVVGGLLMVGLQIFFARSLTGVAMRAAAQDPEAARLMGIDIDRMIRYTFAISGAMGGAAGALLGPIIFASFNMGEVIGIKAFVAATLGGLGSMPGAMVGGILFGVIETFGALFISSGYKDALGYAVMIAILLVAPSGLFGRRARA